MSVSTQNVIGREPRPTPRLPVLLIGNSVRLIGSLKSALRSRGCVFDHAVGSADALRQLRRGAYGVVITDPRTTIEEDLALLEEMRAIQPNIKVIILAPSGTSDEIIGTLRKQVFVCMCAPFDAAEITRYAESAVEQAEQPVGIEVLSADRNWVSVRMNCTMLNADRLVTFFSQLRMDVPEPPCEQLLTAFREILANGIEHGAHGDESKFIEAAAVRTARTMVFYVADPGRGFRRGGALLHAAVANPPDEPIRHIEIREKAGMRPGGYGILLAQGVVDELIYNESGNEAILIKYLPPSAT